MAQVRFPSPGEPVLPAGAPPLLDIEKLVNASIKINKVTAKNKAIAIL